MYKPLQVLALTSTQTGGAKSVSIGPRYGQGAVPWKYSIQAEVTLTSDGSPATASAGTLSVRGKMPGATGFQELGVITLTAPDPVIFEGFYDAIEAVSTGFDSDKTWTLNIVSGD